MALQQLVCATQWGKGIQMREVIFGDLKHIYRKYTVLWYEEHGESM
jgi:hypothetical protein